MSPHPVPVELYYRLAGSFFEVSGTIEHSTDPDTGEPTHTAKADAAVVVRADPSDAARVRLPNPADHGSHDLSLKLASDGRLLSASGSAKGILGDVVAASATVIGFVGGLIGAASGPALLRKAADAPTPAQQWKEQHADDAQRLSDGARVIKQLRASVLATAEAMASDDLPAMHQRKLIGLNSAIAAVEADISDINLRRSAWLSATFTTSESHAITVPSEALFTMTCDGRPKPEIAVSDLRDGGVDARAALETLGLALVAVNPASGDAWTTQDAETIADLAADLERGQQTPGVFFRVPRPASIAFYNVTSWSADGRPDALTLSHLEHLWLLDSRSRLGSVPLSGGELTASVTFSETGVPETIAVSEKSRLAEALGALAGAPEKLSAGLTSAKGVVDTWGSLRSSRADREIAALESRKKALETEIATRGLEADARGRETLQELKDQLDRLKVRKDIGDMTLTPGTPTPQQQAEAERDHLLERLRVDVGIARAQAQLAAYSGS